MRSLLVGVVLVLVSCQPSDCAARIRAPLWGNLTPGSYSVGFQTLFVRDTTRPWRATGATGTDRDPGRPIRISIWYPAEGGEKSPAMTYGDYFHYAGPPDFRALNDTLERRDRESWISDLSEGSQAGRELAARLFTTRVAATADAPGAPGRFPVLLYAAGRGSRADANVELGEYLASHGYIVATVPRLGPSDVNLELGSSPGEALLHEKDLDFAWAILRQLSSVDTTSVSIAGHSAGGIVAMQFGMTHSGIAAVIGLDASYGMRGEERAGSAVRSRAEEFPDFEPAHLTAAVLDLRRAAGVQGAVLDSSVVAALTASDRYVVTMSRMYHGDFTEFAPIAVSLGLPWVTAADGRTRQTGLAGNEHAYRAVLEFLEAKVRHAAGALDTMSADLHPLNGVMLVHRPPEKAIR